ncbi:hypothetical protein Pmani_024846 [Petrolisthes manimaculis]|uniref:Uncharacterized protein n=1 Tax=Petrolisthes manimaculis TaxID=1843537 RepID=A0AAE1P956_9EUCA|nr:hypothetical protein Pmani_024846 [Petrolisthes manimaculis]
MRFTGPPPSPLTQQPSPLPTNPPPSLAVPLPHTSLFTTPSTLPSLGQDSSQPGGMHGTTHEEEPTSPRPTPEPRGHLLARQDTHDAQRSEGQQHLGVKRKDAGTGGREGGMGRG